VRKNLAHTNPPAFKTPIFDLFSLVAFLPYSEKVQLTLGSPLRALRAQEEHRTLSLSPQEGGAKTAKCTKFEQ